MAKQESFIAGKEMDAEKLKMLQDFQQIENWKDYAYWMFQERECNLACNPTCANVIKGSEECNLLRRIKKCYEYSASCIVIARNCEEALDVIKEVPTTLQGIIDPVVYIDVNFEENLEYFASGFDLEDAEEICRFNFKKHLKYMDMYK